MRHPILKLAAVGVLGFALWKVAAIAFLPLVGFLLKGVLIVALVMLAMWFFQKKRQDEKDKEKPAER